jgi:hypothetical protein
MRARYLTTLLTPALLLLGLSMLTTPTALAEGTPDGETPANEGVCDELIGGTPGLYGLCVGFCEAQDCEATLDDATDEVNFDESCKPSSPGLLETYNKRASASDPHMPCLNVVATECPCWTEEELDGVADEDGGFFCEETDSETQIAGIEICPGRIVRPEHASTSDPNTCSFRMVSDPRDCRTISRAFSITPDEYMVCRESIRAECDARGFPIP